MAAEERLSSARLWSALERLGHSVEPSDGNDIVGWWDFGSVLFLVRGDQGEILSLLATWRADLAETDYIFAQELCNAWNADHWWPKAYVARRTDGAVMARAEHTVDYEHGVTDDQLDLHIAGSLANFAAFFDELAEAFPDL